jgi:hypothetical protein
MYFNGGGGGCMPPVLSGDKQIMAAVAVVAVQTIGLHLIRGIKKLACTYPHS